MTSPNMIGKEFDNLVQRVVYGFLGSYPDFTPIASADASEESQRQMHAFLWEVISGIYAHPEVLGIEPAPDDCYEGWQVNNTKPELIKLMRRTLKPVVDFYTFLHALGVHGVIEQNKLRVSTTEVKAKKAHLHALRSFGIESDPQKDRALYWSVKYPSIFPAWKLLSRTSAPSEKDVVFLFSHCIFDTSQDYLLAMLTGFDPSSADSLVAFDQHLREKGYARQVYHEGAEIWGVTYQKDGERRFNLQYDSRKRNQMHYNLRLSQFKSFWQRFAEVDANAQQLLVEMTRPCRGCGGCKKINIKTMGPFTTDVTGEERTLCPWYPNSEWWGHLSDAQIAGIRNLLAMQETILQDRN